MKIGVYVNRVMFILGDSSTMSKRNDKPKKDSSKDIMNTVS